MALTLGSSTPTRCSASLKQLSPLARQQIRAHQQAPIGEFLQADVLQDDLPGPLPRGLHDGLRHGGRAEFHLGLELLPDHLVAQPVGEPRARCGGADVFETGRR